MNKDSKWDASWVDFSCDSESLSNMRVVEAKTYVGHILVVLQRSYKVQKKLKHLWVLEKQI